MQLNKNQIISTLFFRFASCKFSSLGNQPRFGVGSNWETSFWPTQCFTKSQRKFSHHLHLLLHFYPIMFILFKWIDSFEVCSVHVLLTYTFYILRHYHFLKLQPLIYKYISIIPRCKPNFSSTQMDVDKISEKSDREVALMNTVHELQTHYYTHVKS